MSQQSVFDFIQEFSRKNPDGWVGSVEVCKALGISNGTAAHCLARLRVRNDVLFIRARGRGRIVYKAKA